MYKLFLAIFYIILIFGCSSPELKVITSYKESDLTYFCPNPESEIILSASYVDHKFQKDFFGGKSPTGIIPILLCISNGSKNTLGVSENNFSLHFDSPGAMSSSIGTKVESGNGSMSSTLAFVGGTAAIGLVPGIIIASAVEMQASANSTEIVINMRNVRFSSGVIRPETVKAGFLYIENKNLPGKFNLDVWSVVGELMDLDTKNKLFISSTISRFQ